MTNVHEAITAHTSKQHAHLQHFLKLEQLRERAIDEAVALCAAGKPFGVGAINDATARINAHAKEGISPTRINVTETMIRDLVAKRQSS